MGQQKSTDWQPTPKQLDLLKAASEIGFGRSISAICLQAGVDRTSYYDWIKNDPGFKAEWEALPKKILYAHIPGIYQALITKANAGDVPAIKLALELSGDYVPPAQRIDATVTVTIADELKKARERAAAKR